MAFQTEKAYFSVVARCLARSVWLKCPFRTVDVESKKRKPNVFLGFRVALMSPAIQSTTSSAGEKILNEQKKSLFLVPIYVGLNTKSTSCATKKETEQHFLLCSSCKILKVRRRQACFGEEVTFLRSGKATHCRPITQVRCACEYKMDQSRQRERRI